MIIEFMIAASNVTETFMSFEDALYKNWWDKSSKSKNDYDYLKLQNYIRKYPLIVKLSGLWVTKINGVKVPSSIGIFYHLCGGFRFRFRFRRRS